MANFRAPFLDQWGTGGTEFPDTFQNCGTGENDVPATASITHSWASPGNVTSQSGSSTSNLATSGGGVYVLPYIRASNFGFAIPTGATILGIEVEVVWGSGSSVYTQQDLRLAWGASAVNLSTANRADGSTLNTMDQSLEVWGGAADLWGELASTLNPTVINSSDFGWVFKANRADTNTFLNTIRIDCMRATVYYSLSEPLAGAARTTQTEALVLVTEAKPVRVTQVYSETLAGIIIPATVPAGRRQIIVAT